VCWVMDLHPDVEFELGVFNRRSLVPRLLDKLNGFHLRMADRCVVLGSHMGDRLFAKNVALERITPIAVWGHEIELEDEPQAVDASSDRITVMYSGNAGLAHTFDAICQAALALSDDARFEFLFVGGGRRMSEVREFQQRHSLNNIRITAYVPRNQLGRSLKLGDVHLISLRDGMAGAAVPSKLYGIMAACRPVAFLGPESCETADAIREAQCGVALSTDDAAGLVEFLQRIANNPDLRRQLGENARKAFEEHYQPSVCCEQWRPLLEHLDHDGAPAQPATAQ